MVVPGMIKNIFMFPIESVLLALFLGVMLPITNRLGLTYSVGHSKEALKFNKKQIVTLAVLFALGCGCVAGYLGYYYENNSLTKNYSAEEVVEKNQEMYDIISGRTRENKPCVAIIEYAKKPFLSKEVTYTVAYYAITPADGSAAENFDQTQLWSLKKTPAAKNENLTRLGTAVIVCRAAARAPHTPGAQRPTALFAASGVPHEPHRRHRRPRARGPGLTTQKRPKDTRKRVLFLHLQHETSMCCRKAVKLHIPKRLFLEFCIKIAKRFAFCERACYTV